MIRLLAAEPSVTSITLYDTTRGREAVSVRATRVLRAAAGTEAGRRVAGALRLRRLAAARRRAERARLPAPAASRPPPPARTAVPVCALRVREKSEPPFAADQCDALADGALPRRSPFSRCERQAQKLLCVLREYWLHVRSLLRSAHL